MTTRQVEVGPDEDLVVVRPPDEFVHAARVVVVAGAQDVDEPLRLGLEPELLTATVDREPRGRFAPSQVDIGEVEGSVPDDAPAQAGAELVAREVGDRRARRAVADQRLGASEVVAGSAHLVGAAARDGVDAAAGEHALPDVIGRDDELQFLDGVEADRLALRLAARGTRGREPEDVVVDRAVDLHVVIAVVLPRHADAVRVGVERNRREVRRHAGKVEQAAADRRQGLDGLARNVGSRAGARRIDDRGLGGDGDGLRDRRQDELEVHLPLLAERDLDVADLALAEAAQARGHLVGAADAHVEQVEAAFTVGRGLVDSPRGLVDGLDGDAGQHRALLIGGQAIDGAGRHGLAVAGLCPRHHRDGDAEHGSSDVLHRCTPGETPR